MKPDHFPTRSQFIREIIGLAILGFLIAVLFWMAFFYRLEP